MNPYKFKVVEWYNSGSVNGVYNRIITSAATLKGCLSQYNKHIETFNLVKVDRKVVKTIFYCDGVPFDVSL